MERCDVIEMFAAISVLYPRDTAFANATDKSSEITGRQNVIAQGIVSANNVRKSSISSRYNKSLNYRSVCKNIDRCPAGVSKRILINRLAVHASENRSCNHIISLSRIIRRSR